MLKGFKDFIMRGNVVDLAVGIVIGAAFTTVVNQLTKSFLEPLIKLIGGGGELAGEWNPTKGVVFAWAAFLNAVITFLLTAAALYFLVVLPMNKLAERRRRGEEPEPSAPSEEVRLLTEIRDALVGAGAGARDGSALDAIRAKDRAAD
ncbi:MAG TPA: large conductance mechanosensitive channel protein MscL [Pilimelia sp.]|nr:large conductance mechanosensitive channel protein MscL [Pilimelia sp.]